MGHGYEIREEMAGRVQMYHTDWSNLPVLHVPHTAAAACIANFDVLWSVCPYLSFVVLHL